MSRSVDAIYEAGVFRPLEPVTLSEHKRVRLTVEEPVDPARSEAINPRHEELQWLAKESAAYRGQWVALVGPRLISHGEDLAAVRSAALAAGFEDALFASVPSEPDVPFGGW
ncbi:hypothetical protein F183_A37350 [Bryobacterales bacterium F-183]|nr:hypothetical protein F183_A37350 [Bryobacterales bacterium F-183]